MYFKIMADDAARQCLQYVDTTRKGRVNKSGSTSVLKPNMANSMWLTHLIGRPESRSTIRGRIEIDVPMARFVTIPPH